MEAIIPALANMERVNVGTCVEFSKIEAPLSVRKAMFDRFKKARPKGIDVPDEEIQEMVNEVRYRKGR
ncbi:MAG: hypothetical protein LBU89_03780 [Fibromonadaceae bacterium]|jgi:hypothetical protein|nr:hypothetical protein [Fibromonadaceae bacterium]